ncbi:MAG TPA: VOC family protein [Gaiellaceae bacterium]|nr:VOC family protein [Gaiellaceae bacterium]
MEPRVDVITLAVEDLERALRFYRDGLGFESRGVVGTQWTDAESGASGAIAVFELESGLLLSRDPRSDLAKDAAIPAGPARPGEFSLGHLVRSRAEVDELLEQAQAAGAAVTAARERPWGIYSGYFRDLDGHLWEIIWNPGAD